MSTNQEEQGWINKFFNLTKEGGSELTSNKDASNGYAGLTLLKINFKNVLNTITSFFTNSNTVARTYTFQDRDGTIIDNTNLATGSTDNAILRADGTGGRTTQSSGITIDDSNNIVLPTTAAGASTGIIYKGSVRWMHNRKGNTSTTGGNTFIGLNAGNLTLDWGGANAFEASQNVAIGDSALNALTTGYNNVGMGANAGILITTGNANFALGVNTLTKVTTAIDNAAVGTRAGRFITGSTNTLMGTDAGLGVDGSSTGASNTGIGYSALKAITTGTNNVCLGHTAGDVITSGSGNIIIGQGQDPSGATVSNEINIGGRIFAGRTGSPEGVVTAGVGSMFLRSDGGAGTTLYIKESGAGNTGWISK